MAWSLQLTITFKKEDDDPEKIQSSEYFYAGGLVEYVKWLNTEKVDLCLYLALRPMINSRF